MSTEDLRISDGTTEVALFSGIDGVYLNAWRPAITQPKGGGTYMASALSDGRRLADRRLDNVVETFDLKVRAADQDALAQTMQDLRRLLESAVQYWTTSWQDTPVYLVAQGSCETEARYAVIHNWSTPSDENPFAQPYLQPRGAAVANDWTLSVERGHWTENPPGTDQCVQVSATQVGTTYSTGIYRPTQPTDDCYIDSDLFTINLAGAALLIGQVPNRYDAGIRFRRDESRRGRGRQEKALSL